MNFQRRLAIGMLSLTALYTGAGQALGLGDLQLQSALNQPLQAVIQLQGSENLSPSDVAVSLADAETFARAGIERPHFLTDLRFTPMMRDHQLVIRVESSHPVREPYLNFLVQIARSNGLLVREYTLLLDPPLYKPAAIMAFTPPQVTDVVPQSKETVSQRSVFVDVSHLPALQPQPGASRYQTVAGDNLWGIASATRVNESVSMQRQMNAIRALNPHAFVNGDPDRLRTGQELTLPVAQQVGAVLVTAQQENVVEAGGQSMAEAPSPRNDRLRIEELETQLVDEENAALQSRLDILEARFQELLGELELRDTQIASLQVELETMRQSRDAEQQASGQTTVTGASQPGALANAFHAVQVVSPGQQDSDEPGTVETTAWATQGATHQHWFSRWWPAFVVLLAVVAGALLLRLRRDSAQSPLPVTAPPGSQAASALGSRAADPLKTHDPHLLHAHQQHKAEQSKESVDAFWSDNVALNLDDLELEQNWELFDELDGPRGKRKEVVQEVEEPFETNLQDFPEVAEVDGVQVQQSDPTRMSESKR